MNTSFFAYPMIWAKASSLIELLAKLIWLSPHNPISVDEYLILNELSPWTRMPIPSDPRRLCETSSLRICRLICKSTLMAKSRRNISAGIGIAPRRIRVVTRIRGKKLTTFLADEAMVRQIEQVTAASKHDRHLGWTEAFPGLKNELGSRRFDPREIGLWLDCVEPIQPIYDAVL